MHKIYTTYSVHPDKNPDQDTSKQFLKLNLAYNFAKDNFKDNPYQPGLHHRTALRTRTPGVKTRVIRTGFRKDHTQRQKEKEQTIERKSRLSF